MFSVDNFYDYLIHCYSWPKESNNLVYIFNEHGSRDLSRFYPQTKNLSTLAMSRFLGGLFQFDQEPFFFDYYSFDYELYNYSSHTLFNHTENIINSLSRVYTPIICHSELNSTEIKILKGNGFLDAHYWWHGIISQDWFRDLKYYKFPVSANKKRFGLYARSAGGSRKYRIDLLNQLSDINKNVYFEFQPEILQQCDIQLQNKWPISNTCYSSSSSANINWNDIEKFNIQIVAETIFDTEKTHLTEKILKPIVMGQPFILLSSPHSLEYIKKYGFKTFDHIWDEQYDTILNYSERLACIIKLIKSINSLSTTDFNKLIEKTVAITKYNREHFFSDKFQHILLSELHDNINTAIEIQKEQFFNIPGGLLFKYYNEAFLRNNNKKVDTHYKIAKEIITFMQDQYPDVAKQIIKKYGHLF